MIFAFLVVFDKVVFKISSSHFVILKVITVKGFSVSRLVNSLLTALTGFANKDFFSISGGHIRPFDYFGTSRGGHRASAFLF